MCIIFCFAIWISYIINQQNVKSKLYKTLVISIIEPLLDNTFHLQWYNLHSNLLVNTMLQKTIQIQLRNPSLAIDNDENTMHGQ